MHVCTQVLRDGGNSCDSIVRMSKQTYYYVASGVLLLVAVGHLARILNDWEAMMAGIEIPMWVSYAAVVIAGYLAVRGFMFGRKL